MPNEKTKWPTMPTIKLRPRGEVEIAIDATVTMAGKCVVVIHPMNTPNVDDTVYFPDDAERVGRALIKAAVVARAKRDHARRPR